MLYIAAATFIALTVVVGLVRGRRHILWKNPGYNPFTSTWSDERKPDDGPPS